MGPQTDPMVAPPDARPPRRLDARLGLLFLVCALLGLAAPGAAQRRGKQAPPLRPWLGDYDSAQRASLERNTPLLVVVIQEGEEANDRFRDGIWKAKDFAFAVQPVIVVLVNDGRHPPEVVKEERNGVETEVQRCSVYHTPTCADHKRNWTRAYQEFNEGGEMKTPQVLAVLPSGEVEDRLVDVPALARVVKMIEAARAKAGPSLSAEELLEVRRSLGSAASYEKGRVWPQAWAAYARVLELTAASVYADDARAGIERALAGMQGEIDAALARIEAGEVARGYRKLLDLAQELAPTPLAKPLGKTIKGIERTKEYKDVVQGVKRELAAEALWDKVSAALAAGKDKAAERHAKTLLRKYGDTPAAGLARDRFPHLVEGDGAPAPTGC